MIKRLFSSATTSVVSAAAIVAAFSALSRVFGFVRDHILSGLFGDRLQVLDVYYAASQIPDLVLQLIVIGALSACFIPIFNRYYHKDVSKAWAYTTNMVNALLLAFLVVAVLGAILAPWYTPLLVKLPADEIAQVVSETRVFFLAQCFFAVSMVFGSVLQGTKRFVLYSAAPIVNNVGIIIGAVFLVPLFGPIGLAWGAVFGASMHALLQTVGVYALGYRYAFKLQLFDKDLIQTFQQMVPRVLGLAVGQINFLVMTFLVSGLGHGSITVLEFSNNLNLLPVGVIGVSYAIAAFPTFCEYANGNDKDRLRQSFSATVRQVMFLIIPATIMTLLLRAQIVRLVYGARHFEWATTIATADALAMFAISFFAQSLIYVVIRMYFAYEDTRTPLVIGFVTTAVNLIVGHWLAPVYGVAGLALAFSLATMFQLILLWLCLKAKIGSLDEAHLIRSTLALSISGLVAAMVTQGLKIFVSGYIDLNTYLHVILQAGIAGGAGLATYFAMAYLFKSPEMLAFVSGLHARFIKTSKVAETIQQNVV